MARMTRLELLAGPIVATILVLFENGMIPPVMSGKPTTPKTLYRLTAKIEMEIWYPHTASHIETQIRSAASPPAQSNGRKAIITRSIIP